MLNTNYLLDRLEQNNISFFTGVPDSQLKALCDCLMERFGIGEQHIVAANEGNAVGLAAGYHMATGKIPCVYMQNSGLGNVVNPVASLLNEKVYKIPTLFFVGWRGEPGVKDEPQHIFQGEITLKLLEDMGIAAEILDKATTPQDFERMLSRFLEILRAGGCAAFVVRKGALEFDGKANYHNSYRILREEAIRHIVKAAGEDVVVSTTGKPSRELFEIREQNGQPHRYDFLTVGSMGHSSMIALGIALNKPERRIWCVDGDGAVLMHMGAAAVIGAKQPKNLIHIVLNNNAHETVGGMPTVASTADFCKIAEACGYRKVLRVTEEEQLDAALEQAKGLNGPVFVEIMVGLGSRADLGRPTTTALENKENFMKFLEG
ncbi:MAG: phosphonopyruvate decarboxylase [Oscillospiraceae bacterium]